MTEEAEVLAEERDVGETVSEEAAVLGEARGAWTGDESHMLLWILLLIASGAGLSAAIICLRSAPGGRRKP